MLRHELEPVLVTTESPQCLQPTPSLQFWWHVFFRVMLRGWGLWENWGFWCLHWPQALSPPTSAPVGEAVLFWLQRQAVLCHQITPLLTLQFSPLPLLEISLILAQESWPPALKPFLFILAIYLKCIHTEILQLVPPFSFFTCSSRTARGLGFLWGLLGGSSLTSLSEVGFHYLLRVYVFLNMALNFWNSFLFKEQKDQ